MNELEAEYSFLAPTWRLPPVATSSIYSKGVGTTYLPSTTILGSDWPAYSSQNYGSRYVPSFIPPTNTRSSYNNTLNTYPENNENQQTRSHYGSDDGLNLTISVHPANEPPRANVQLNRTFHYSNNDSLNQSTNNNNNQRRRVQIVDHSRQTPSTTINDYSNGKSSRNSNLTPTFQQQSRTPDPVYVQPKYGSTVTSQNTNNVSIPAAGPHSYSQTHREHPDTSRPNQNGTIHEYLYGLSNPDPGSYVNAYRNHQRRLQEEKLGRKSVMSDYKNFAQNGGFGPSFVGSDQYSNIDRSHIERKRRDYSKVVKENNQHKIDEQRRANGFSRQNANRPAPVPKSQRAREYAETIERPHHLRPVMRLRDPNSGNIIVRDPHRDYDPRIDS